jgi:predicted transcriptional regulator
MSNITDNKDMAKHKTMSFQIDPDIRSVLDEQAEFQDRSISWLINNYLRQAMEVNKLLKPKDKSKKNTLKHSYVQ